MKLNTFKLEDYLEKHEFSAPYLLCCSDPESWSLKEVLEMANEHEKDLWENLRLSYSEVQGLPLLRHTIATQLFPGLTAENILCFGGASDGIFCSLFALCNPGDHVIAVTPCYQSLIEIPLMKECSVSKIELKEEQNWELDLSAIEREICSNTKGVIINFPHNPTGSILSQDKLKKLCALCEKNDLWLFSDEVYRMLGTKESDLSNPAACVYSKAISLGVTSKAFGMGGLRIGWVACQDKEMLKKITKTKHYTTICNSALSEIITQIAVRNKDKIFARNNEIVFNNLQILDRFFEKYSNLFSWVRPKGGCIGFVQYKGTENVDDFCQKVLKETGILLMPSSMYDVHTNHFRIGFGRKNMPEALARLEGFLDFHSL